MNQRLKIVVRGAVQGVGFRPFIYRIATEMNLNGCVLNSTAGVMIEVEGEKELLNKFLFRIEKDKPPVSIINSLEFSFLDPVGFENFQILNSDSKEKASTLILPDIAICDDCKREMLDPNDRRYLYPFINCTNCGPRFSIIESLPYDRPNTSMKIFEMCDDCRREYNDPMNRRFHAQPIACPNCGPHIELWDEHGELLLTKNEALQRSAEIIREGKIIALKGLGGFQLIVDALNTDAVRRLRMRKRREEKPFALMFPTLNEVKKVCEVSKFEERLLQSSESPIVLLKKIKQQIKSNGREISESAAPDNPYFGAMLPYTPLHVLLLRELNIPIVATSANISEEPIVIDEHEALKKLSGIADYYLVHNRPIVRHVDDSIVRIVRDREMVMRRARGYAPLPVTINTKHDSGETKNILAVGGHLKNTVALLVDKNIFTSQHIGDLSTAESFNTFEKVIRDFQTLYESSDVLAACDLHPDYVSTKFAKEKFGDVIQIQHHKAHVAACRMENQVEGEALGVSWDGTGFGYDETIWGGEFFVTNDNGDYKHFAQLKKFHLPGGELAIKEPRRSAIGILYESFGDNLFDQDVELLDQFSAQELKLIRQMLEKKINSPLTSSAGRLFDGIASLLGIKQKLNYEGQAAMMLEFSADESEYASYPFEIIDTEPLTIDWRPIIKEILSYRAKNSVGKISARFHNTLAEIICEVAKRSKLNKVVLSGGCFQNAYLLNRTIEKLQKNNFSVYWHQRIPPNDGGIAVGQIALALNRLSKEKSFYSSEKIKGS
ncbi:MAG: carbamoyltransferase HypF [Bacteroidetes bacterium]|nr:carbamoyltransferase HypF [Bacteroidota bacterium]